ncbi:hypothetical protein [Alcanivorax sp. DP30]|uniref:hypothetical protein n=1 Tax=Alcanivorax sp. DP30 TaxID=2606217 RepID=UPI0013CA0171|nr:hypothetical protein [Alcanivorax sp. DP30]MZR63211.1 hypothetical protein [Alcanivorax sp. DP30]
MVVPSDFPVGRAGHAIDLGCDIVSRIQQSPQRTLSISLPCQDGGDHISKKLFILALCELMVS